ncbi:MAG: hypothetical protein ACUVTR_02015 [Dehalococcoidia bacterium]
MVDIVEKIKQYGSLFGTGLMKEAAPAIANGFINELFHRWHIDVAMITQYVQNNQSVWDKLAPDTRNQLGILVKKVGNLDFITPAFLITAIKKDFPAVASLFLNWPEAAEWLDKQINDLKAGIANIDQIP